jgi:hypothetical protein
MSGQRIELPPFSMYAKTPPYEVDGQIVFGLMVDTTLPDPSDEQWPVPSAGTGRLDLLSDAFYGTPELWHVLSSVNNWPDALIGFPAGMVIRVPTKERLAAEGVLNV